MDKAFRVWTWIMDQVVGYLAAALMLGATGLAIVEIVRRYLLDRTFHWGQDAVTYTMVSAVFLFFVVTQLRRSHLAVTALNEWLANRGHHRAIQVLRLVNTTLALGFAGALTWWGVPAVARNYELGRLTQSMILPFWPFQAALLLSLALLIVTLLFQLYQDIQSLRGKDVFPWADSEEGLEV